MKVVRFYIVILFVLIGLCLNGNPFKQDTIKSLNSSIILEIPNRLHYKKTSQIYSEGQIHILNFHNQSYIMVIDGGLLKLDTDSIMHLERNVKPNQRNYVGNKENKYYRKDIISDMIFYYGNVPNEDKLLFDSIFNNIIIIPQERIF